MRSERVEPGPGRHSKSPGGPSVTVLSERHWVQGLGGAIIVERKEGTAIIRRCDSADLDAIYSIINQAAQAYKRVIPADR